MTFKELGLSAELGDVIEQLGYSSPTPIQEESIPAILQGRDILACAQTGTGKTAAFLLPIIEILQNSRSRQGLPSAIIMVPTRELAAQIVENFNAYTSGKGAARSLTAISIVGGEVISTQERLLKKGVDVIIATPGRLVDLLERGKIICTNIKIVVIDEADRMLDMGFMPDVDRILSGLPKLRQTLLFSATVPEEIKKISQLYQMKPKEVKISRSAMTGELIDQKIIRITDAQKQKALVHLLTDMLENEPAVVFCNRKKDIDVLTRFLVQTGFPAEALHGDMNQRNRNETLDRFRQEKFRILVTSDVAARGIDVTGIGLVVNYNVPINEEDYVHRIGRTGRAGLAGRAIMFVMKSEEKRLKTIEKLINKPIPEMDFAHEIDILSSESEPLKKKAVDGKKGRKPSPRAEGSPSVEKDEVVETRREEKKRPIDNRSARSRTTSRTPREEDIDSNQPIIGFGQSLPSFMKIDPLKCLK